MEPDMLHVPKWMYGLIVAFAGWMTHQAIGLNTVTVEARQLHKIADQVKVNQDAIKLVREEQLKRTVSVYDVPKLHADVIQLQAKFEFIEKELAALKEKMGMN